MTVFIAGVGSPSVIETEDLFDRRLGVDSGKPLCLRQSKLRKSQGAGSCSTILDELKGVFT